MKSQLLILLMFFSTCMLPAQLTITPGSQFSAVGNIQLTLQNTNLVNNGNFTNGSSIIRFTGNASSSISGFQPVQFFELELNKSNNTSLVLQRALDVRHRILFSSGFLNLNGFNTDLGTTGFLDGEKETSRVTGANGGRVLFTTMLNAPAAANPGNLGAIISSTQNLGNVIIQRGHEAQANGMGLASSILRYYDILPASNADLNATLRLNYFDGELNNMNENSLVLFKTNDGVNWSNQRFSSKDANTNFVEMTGIGSFSRWTLSSDNSPLPVHFILFDVKCEDDEVMVTWKTAQEQNSSHFSIERSTDGVRWTVIGNLPAARNSNTERSYSFTVNGSVQHAHYRIAQYDLDDRVQYTNVIRSSCSLTEKFTLWPNPTNGALFLNIAARNESQVVIKIFDSKGSLVKVQNAKILPGSNQIRTDIESLADGVYSLQVVWNNGDQMKKTVQVIKQ
jgi:hypothetical protein